MDECVDLRRNLLALQCTKRGVLPNHCHELHDLLEHLPCSTPVGVTQCLGKFHSKRGVGCCSSKRSKGSRIVFHTRCKHLRGFVPLELVQESEQQTLVPGKRACELVEYVLAHVLRDASGVRPQTTSSEKQMRVRTVQQHVIARELVDGR